MSLVNRKKRSGAELADAARSAQLFKGDDAKVEQLCQKLKKGPAEVVRQLVSEALIQQEIGSRESEPGDGLSRRDLADQLDEQLRPFRQELADVKGCLRELASMIGDLQNPRAPRVEEDSASLNEVLPNIDQNLDLIHKKIVAGFDAFVGLTKLIGERQNRADARAQAWHEATYAAITRRDLLGHSTVQMSDDYTHSSAESRLRAVESIADHRKQDYSKITTKSDKETRLQIAS